MIIKMILSTNDNLKPATVKWDENEDDFVVNVPENITRCNLVDLVEEIKKLTDWIE